MSVKSLMRNRGQRQAAGGSEAPGVVPKARILRGGGGRVLPGTLSRAKVKCARRSDVVPGGNAGQRARPAPKGGRASRSHPRVGALPFVPGNVQELEGLFQ